MSSATTDNVHNDVYDALDPQEAITHLRSEIENTKSLLSALELQAERQQARLSPVLKLNSDELIIIFISCSDQDWKSPLIISAVCRRWRSTVLSCPQAWQNLRFPDHLPRSIVNIHLARSQPCLLHMSSPNIDPSHSTWRKSNLDVINQTSTRIKCLSVCAQELGFLTEVFPKLRKLMLTTNYAPTTLKYLTSHRFPRLRFIHAQEFDGTHWRYEKLPPIKDLVFRTDYQLTWIKAWFFWRTTLYHYVSGSITSRTNRRGLFPCTCRSSNTLLSFLMTQAAGTSRRTPLLYALMSRSSQFSGALWRSTSS